MFFPSKQPNKYLVFTMDKNITVRVAWIWANEYGGINKSENIPPCKEKYAIIPNQLQRGLDLSV